MSKTSFFYCNHKHLSDFFIMSLTKVFPYIFTFGVDNQPDKDSSGNAYQHIHWEKARQGQRENSGKSVLDT